MQATAVITWFDHITVASVLLMVVTAGIFAVLVSWHRNPDDTFDLRQSVVDSTTGKIAVEKMGYMVALAYGTWIMVALVEANKMSENYYTIFLSVFAVVRVASSGISAMKDVSMEKAKSGAANG